MNKLENQYALRWAKKIKAIDLLGGACEVCGLSDQILIEFHHEKDKNKIFNQLRHLRWSLLETEIKKCKLLCGNCHQKHHYSTKSNSLYFDFKSKLLSIIDVQACRCGESFLGCLEFHHVVDNKEFIISDYIRKFRLSHELLSEIKKCDVLCRNCHKKEHFDYEKHQCLIPLIKRKVINYIETNKPVNRQEISRLYSKGFSNVEIARKLECAKSTVTYALQQLSVKPKRTTCNQIRSM
jgi:hypothetical protein